MSMTWNHRFRLSQKTYSTVKVITGSLLVTEQRKSYIKAFLQHEIHLWGPHVSADVGFRCYRMAGLAFALAAASALLRIGS